MKNPFLVPSVGDVFKHSFDIHRELVFIRDNENGSGLFEEVESKRSSSEIELVIKERKFQTIEYNGFIW
ncbi:MAG: hypothetical protein V7765_20985 [Oleispira sp.]